MSKIKNIELIIESALLVSQNPLSTRELVDLFESNKPSKSVIKQAIETLNKSYVNRSFEIVEVASGFRIQIKNGYDEWLAKLEKQISSRFSKAFLETLVIIAYKQPVTRGDIENIRGVSVNPQIIRNMVEYEWIRIVGHKDTPGKPELLATTKKFLDHFNLRSINELPEIKEPNV
tara:strand:+ start:11765 stop:12289 length:525 start_codon:yes stop_codon:yes gene_type:complete